MIRAYLDELAFLKTTVQLWVPQSDAPPFETLISRISGDTFITETTPPWPVEQQLYLSFLLESRRFTAPTRVLSTGVFRIPSTVVEGERRERFRATFTRVEGIEVTAVERIAGPFLLGRLLQGALLDLSLQGLKLAVDELGDLGGGGGPLTRGDVFELVVIRGLPYTPEIRCRGLVAHVNPSAGGEPAAGLLLEGLEPLDQKAIERILARRFPTTFGQAFPKRKRKTDIADKVGAPILKPVASKAPEVVELPTLAPKADKPARPVSSPLMRIRKAGRRILVISAAGGGGQRLASELQDDEFRQVQVADSFLEARRLAASARYDLVLLDVKVGGHLGQMLLEALHKHGLLAEVPVILVADRRDAHIEGVAEEVQAVHLHDRREGYEALAPVIYSLLLQ